MSVRAHVQEGLEYGVDAPARMQIWLARMHVFAERRNAEQLLSGAPTEG